jgi:hypothetical protein
MIGIRDGVPEQIVSVGIYACLPERGWRRAVPAWDDSFSGPV